MDNMVYVASLTVLTLPQIVISSDGFMLDFFKRFPNLPFGNMNSFKYLHDQGSMPVTNSLIPKDDDFPFHKESENYFQSKLSRFQTNDRSSKEFEARTKKHPRIKKQPTTPRSSPRTSTGTARQNNKNAYRKDTKKILFKKYPKSTITTALYKNVPKKTTISTSTYAQSYDNFKIVSTTPVYGKDNRLPSYGTSKLQQMRKSFVSYSDQFSSRHSLYLEDDDFHTQLMRPKMMSDTKYISYDPFLKTSVSEAPPVATLEKHFYYGDTTTMTPPPKYKIRRQKKKGIVINEKANSGEVHNLLDVKEEEVSTTSTSSTTPPPTTSTTTLSPSSVSELPTMIVSELPRTKPKFPPRIKKPKPENKYHYRLTTPKIRLFDKPPTNGIVYSPLSYIRYDFDKFMPAPADLPPVPPSSIQSPKLRYTYTTTTIKPSKKPGGSSTVVVMPPYTPAPNKTTSTTSTTTITNTSTSSSVTTPKHDVYFTPKVNPYYISSIHKSKKPIVLDKSINQDTIKMEVVAAGDGGESELDIDVENNTYSHTHDPAPVYKYKYKMKGGHINNVTKYKNINSPVNVDGGNPDKYLYIFRNRHDQDFSYFDRTVLNNSHSH